MKNFKERRKEKQGKWGMLTRFLIAMFSIQLIFAMNVYGQQTITVNGTVTDEQGQPLPGVTVVQEGTTSGTITNFDGNYTLDVPANGNLVFSFVGYESVEVPVNNRSVIDVGMEIGTQSVDEVVVTGYQTQRKLDVTGAVSVVDLEPIEDIPASNVMQALQGRVPGVYVEQSGNPRGSNEVLIRGISTLGNNSPLYIIDGVATISSDIINSMDPRVIESIQVLKDASAASIYGSRASNGVIIVTTKQGKGKLKVEVNSSVTIQNRFRQIDVLNTNERGEALWLAAMNDGMDNPSGLSDLYDFDWNGDLNNPVLNEVIPVEWVGNDESYGVKASDTYWQDVVYGTGVIQSHNLTISQGSENITALLSLGYYDNEGVVAYTDFQRLTARLNTSYTAFKGILKVGQNFNFSKITETPPPDDVIHKNALFQQPILPVYTVDGDWAGPVGGGFNDPNPLHMLYLNRDDKNNDLTMFGNLYADLMLTKNLTFRSNFGFDYTNTYNKDITKAYQEGDWIRETNSLSIDQGHAPNWVWTNTLNYDVKLKNHAISVLAGMESIKNQSTNLTGTKEKFALQDVDYF
jgi:TonB-linked SusC/RagA family outer membrane protein